MRMLLFIAATVLAATMLAAPALAEEDCYFSEDGGRLLTGGERFTVTFADGELIHCSTGVGGGGEAEVRFVGCDALGFYRSIYFEAASTLGGELDLLVFNDRLWYPCD